MPNDNDDLYNEDLYGGKLVIPFASLQQTMKKKLTLFRPG